MALRSYALLLAAVDALAESARGVQMLSDNRSAEYMRGRRSLEVNPDHPIIQALASDLQSNTEGAEVRQRPPVTLPCASVSLCTKHAPMCIVNLWVGWRRVVYVYALGKSGHSSPRTHMKSFVVSVRTIS